MRSDGRRRCRSKYTRNQIGIVGKLFLSLAPAHDSLAFNSRTCSELQTTRIGLNADLSTAGGLAAGTLQFIGMVPKTSSNARLEKSFPH
jgi:hypothetical protein